MPLCLTLQRGYVYTEVICHLFEDSLIPRAWYHMDRVDSRFAPSQWASYQIRQIVGCACSGNAGNVFPRHRLQRKPCRDACRDRLPAVAGKTFPAFPAHAQTSILLTWQEAHERRRYFVTTSRINWLGANLESALTWRLKAKAFFHRSLIKSVYLPSRFSVHMVFRHIQYTGIITQRFHRSKYRKQTNELTKKQLTSYRTNLQN